MSKQCDFCGKKLSVFDEYRRSINKDKARVCVCEECSRKYDRLLTETDKQEAEKYLNWFIGIISAGKFNPELTSHMYAQMVLSKEKISGKQTDVTESVPEVEKYNLNSFPTGQSVDTTYSGSDSHSSFTSWSIAMAPILLTLMEILGGAIYGGIIGYKIEDDILSVCLGALIGIWLGSTLGGIRRTVTESQRTLTKEINQLKQQNIELSNKIQSLFEEKNK